MGQVRRLEQYLCDVAVVRVPGRAAPGRARRVVALARAAGGLPGRRRRRAWRWTAAGGLPRCAREPARRRVREPLVDFAEPIEVKIGALVHLACRQRAQRLVLPRRRSYVRPEALALLARGADTPPLRARHQCVDPVEDYEHREDGRYEPLLVAVVVVVELPEPLIITQALRRRARGRMQLVPVVLLAPGHVAAQSRVRAAVVPVARVPPQLYPRGPCAFAHAAPVPRSIYRVCRREARAVPLSGRIDARAGRVPQPAPTREPWAARRTAQRCTGCGHGQISQPGAPRWKPQRSALQHPGQHHVRPCTTVQPLIPAIE